LVGMRRICAGRAAQWPGTFFESNNDFHFHVNEGHYPNPLALARGLSLVRTIPDLTRLEGSANCRSGGTERAHRSHEHTHEPHPRRRRDGPRPADFFADKGHEVHSVASAGDALVELARRPFDVAVLDHAREHGGGCLSVHGREMVRPALHPAYRVHGGHPSGDSTGCLASCPARAGFEPFLDILSSCPRAVIEGLTRAFLFRVPGGKSGPESEARRWRHGTLARLGETVRLPPWLWVTITEPRKPEPAPARFLLLRRRFADTRPGSWKCGRCHRFKYHLIVPSEGCEGWMGRHGIGGLGRTWAALRRRVKSTV
jgi:hypothetical protein